MKTEWQSVPKIPTGRMVSAGIEALKDTRGFQEDNVYKAMLEAAPKPEPVETEIYCPFCKEDSFDDLGLKRHLRELDCDVWRKYMSKPDVAFRTVSYTAPRTKGATKTETVTLSKEDFERVKAILLGIDTYLDRNKLNYIASTSIGHKEIKEALSILEKEIKP